MASLVAILVMLYEMLFGGMLLNKATMGRWVRWANEASFWNYAWEALLVNEVKGLTLWDERLNLPIRVSVAFVFVCGGFESSGFWFLTESLGWYTRSPARLFCKRLGWMQMGFGGMWRGWGSCLECFCWWRSCGCSLWLRNGGDCVYIHGVGGP